MWLLSHDLKRKVAGHGTLLFPPVATKNTPMVLKIRYKYSLQLNQSINGLTISLYIMSQSTNYL